jgi:hypothetical protein
MIVLFNIFILSPILPPLFDTHGWASVQTVQSVVDSDTIKILRRSSKSFLLTTSVFH